MEMILNQGHVRGFWDETFFPTIKDMVKYGADVLSESDFLDDVIDALVDSAAGTLGYMAPEFLPAIMAASKEIKDPIHNFANDALKAASDWATRPA
jgi:xanthine dehydrogenase iron-sulfur cluster and FAD-binding subunit A